MTCSTFFFIFIFFSMEFSMFRIIRTESKIFYTIIIADFINMMNKFCWQQISPKMFFHNKAMFHNIFFSAYCKRMFWNINKNISLARCIFTFEENWFLSFFELTRVGLSLKSLTHFEILVWRSNPFSSWHNNIIHNGRYNSISLCEGL